MTPFKQIIVITMNVNSHLHNSEFAQLITMLDPAYDLSITQAT